MGPDPDGEPADDRPHVFHVKPYCSVLYGPEPGLDPEERRAALQGSGFVMTLPRWSVTTSADNTEVPAGKEHALYRRTDVAAVPY
jgi:hypothetical protein